MKILGIDFGTKRIGVAVTDESGKMAFPVSVVKNDSHSISVIAEIARKEKASLIVIGESKDFLMKDNPIMLLAREFEDALFREIGLKIVYEPEFLTSHQAHHIQGKTDMLDSSAATIILQSYLDRLKNHS